VTALIRRNKIQILEAPLDQEAKNFSALLRAKSALVMSHEGMQVRVGEAAVAVKMKQREDWSEVFAAVERAKAQRQRLIDSNMIDESVLDII
jgi:translation initiation factor 2 alpha subunit (eIF-2alpha)